MTKINDYVADVALKLGNRTDLTTGNPSRVAVWLSQAYNNLCMSYPFEQLQVSKNDIFSPGLDTYNYPADARGIIGLSYSPDVTSSSGQSQPIYRKHINVIRYYSTTFGGPPSIYAPFGRQVIVRPVPDLAYPLLWDYWQLPQVTPDIVSTVILTPQDWEDVLKLHATMLGHIDLFERDKASELHTLLFGDPTDPSAPGMIKKKLLQQAAENQAQEYAIRPRQRPYVSGK